MHGGPDLQGLLDERSVLLSHPVRRGAGLEGQCLAVEDIAPILQGQPVGGGTHHPVDRVRDPHLLVEREAHNRQADLRGPVDLETGPDQMGLVVGEVVDVPAEVRVLQEHRPAAGGPAACDGPGVGSILARVAIGRSLRRMLALTPEGGRGDVDVIHQAVGVSHHVDPRDRQDGTHLGIQGAGMSRRVIVDAPGEGVEIRPEGRLLSGVPESCAARHIVADEPGRGGLVLFAPVLGAAATRLTIEPEDLVAVAPRLGIPEPMEDRGGVGAIHMGHPVAIPEDLVPTGGGSDRIAAHTAGSATCQARKRQDQDQKAGSAHRKVHDSGWRRR